MGMNETPSGERVHIGFFGCRNAGKSSLVNAVTGQEMAIVSDTKGTTTDPVTKSMELLPIGPVVIIDTPGIDDEGELGAMRVRRAGKVLAKTDLAILVVDGTVGKNEADEELIRLFEKRDLPYIVVCNKADLLENVPAETEHEIYVSAAKKTGIHELKEKMGRLGKGVGNERILVRDLMEKDQILVLVIPIDSAAPKGRLILPQQQVIRDILEGGGSALCVRDTELQGVIDSIGDKIAMVITDSQAFASVSKIVPDEIPLTSFSILMARYKGYLETALDGAAHFEKLKDGDRILISEGCTHHRQCDDIGTVKLPRFIRNYTGADVVFETSSGLEFPDDLSSYAMVVHCGACMLNEKEVTSRMNQAIDQGIPFTNYGIAIAYMQGIMKRCLRIFPDLLKVVEDAKL